MAKFTRRYSKPTKANLSFVLKADGGWNDCVVGNPTDSQCRCLSNCVGYASGRFNEIYNELSGKTGCNFPYLNCNAENFIERAQKYYSDKLVISQVAKTGAIMCWQKGTLASKDGAGHVAIVEDILERDSNGNPISIRTSESSYGGTAFYNKVRNKGTDGNWGLAGKYSFRAFIWNAIQEDEEPTPTPTSDIKVGDRVIANGKLYSSSNATKACGSVCNKETYVTRYAAGSKHPYNTSGDLGWMDKSSLTKVEDEPVLPVPVAKNTKNCQVFVPSGMCLRIRKGPGTEYEQIGICKANSYYNVLEICEEDDYDWYRLTTNAYIAGVKGVIYYPKESELSDAKKKKLKELQEKKASLEKTLASLEKQVDECKAEIAKVEKQIGEIK